LCTDIKKDKCGETTAVWRTLGMYRIQENDKKLYVYHLGL